MEGGTLQLCAEEGLEVIAFWTTIDRVSICLNAKVYCDVKKQLFTFVILD